MPHDISVFISHSWAYSEHYDTLAKWIFMNPWHSNGVPVNFRDTSVPRDDPIHYAQNAQELKNAIFARIAVSAVVVIPTGMYANYSNWIQKEIDGARQYGKPILAVNPWGQERKSSIVTSAASRTVGWNSETVVNGIWQIRQ